MSDLFEKAAIYIARYRHAETSDIEIIGIEGFEDTYIENTNYKDEISEISVVYCNHKKAIQESLKLLWSCCQGIFCGHRLGMNMQQQPLHLTKRNGGWRELTWEELIMHISVYLADLHDIAPKHLDVSGFVLIEEGTFVYETFQAETSRIKVSYSNDLLADADQQEIFLDWCYDDGSFWYHTIIK